MAGIRTPVTGTIWTLTRTHTALNVSKFRLAYFFFFLSQISGAHVLPDTKKTPHSAGRTLSNESLPLQKTLLRISCIALTKDPLIFGVNNQLPLSL